MTICPATLRVLLRDVFATSCEASSRLIEALHDIRAHALTLAFSAVMQVHGSGQKGPWPMPRAVLRLSAAHSLQLHRKEQ